MLRTMTKRSLFFYIYSIWYKPRLTQVAESNEMKGSQEDLSQKEWHETVAEKTSQTQTPLVAETDEVKELQPEMAEQTSQRDIYNAN